jgi:hypothetical protein
MQAIGGTPGSDAHNLRLSFPAGCGKKEFPQPAPSLLSVPKERTKGKRPFFYPRCATPKSAQSAERLFSLLVPPLKPLSWFWCFGRAGRHLENVVRDPDGETSSLTDVFIFEE